MIVDDLQRAVHDGRCELSARLRGKDGHERRLWFRFPEAYAPAGEIDASPFLVAALVWCLRRGEDLEVDGPVSPRLLGEVEGIVNVYRSLRPGEMKPIAVSAPAAPPQAPPADMTACFFTRGVDSWFAALTAREDDPQTPPLTHAIFSRDFMSDYSGERYQREFDSGATRAAEAAGLEVIHVETNQKREVRGAQLAAMALALGPRRMLIASGAMQGEIVPAGTHPVLDHRFTTERTDIVHYGDASRLAKVRRIARSPMALSTLRVCRVDELESDRNCGRCEKCVRSMLELHVEGALHRCPAFDGDLTPDRVAGVSTRLSRRHQWLDILHSLGSGDLDLRLRAAVRLVIARSDLLSAVDQARALAAEPGAARLGRALPLA
ncbi:MAG: hypothetical protein ACR2NV_10470, partial [Thermoleophilaceae bacterium]